MIEGENIVFLAPRDFSDIFGRVHHFATKLSKSNRVLFVETQESLPFLIRKKKLAKLFCGIFRPLKIVENLWVFTPLFCLPFDGVSESINKLNSALLRWQLKKLFNRLGFKARIIVYYMPNYYRLVKRLGERAAIYDLVDERFALPGRHHKYFASREQRMMTACDLTVVVSEKLLEAKQRLARKIVLIPNGVDADLFGKDYKIPQALNSLVRPIIGYSGAIDTWFDLELVDYLARQRPNWSFVFIGPVRTSVKNVKRLKNVYFIGERPYEELPAYIAAFDCAIVPHKLTTFREFSDPLKVYEYLASAKPVVSTPIPALKRFGELVKLADNPQDFLNAIECELRSDSQEKRLERKRVAKVNDWQVRIEAMSERIKGAIKGDHDM